MQFDLSGIQGNVTSALLTFSVAKVSSPGNIGLHAVLNSWNENTVTFNSAPSFNPAPANSTSITSNNVGGTVSVDISSAAQAWINNPGINHGLALISQGANVEIRSKEGGAGATLEVVTGDPGPSMVVVAPEGGDYTNPLDAAENALEGDQWCSSSCVIFVRAGEYLIDRTLDLIPDDFNPERFITLIGAGSNTTTIKSTPAVETAIVGVDVRSLAIVHTEPFNGEKSGWTTSPFLHPGLVGNDVHISVSGGTVNYGVRTGGELNTPTLSDVRISVAGGIRSAGIFSTDASLTNVEIRASGDMARGILNFDQDGGGLTMEGSEIVALGDSARAVVAAGAGMTITDSSLLARGNAATGIEIDTLAGFSMRLISSTVQGSGSGSSGVSIIPEGFPPIEIDQSRILGETAVSVAEQSGGELSFRIRNSTLNGSQTALALLTYAGNVSIDHSVLFAPVAIDAQSIFDVSIGASKLDGAVNHGTASFTCVYVYNAAYAALDENCQ